jgi:hypothetical protein
MVEITAISGTIQAVEAERRKVAYENPDREEDC